MEYHSPDIYGDIKLAGNSGSAGQVLVSQGVGSQAIWSNQVQLSRKYLATDKTAQTIVLGPADVTWNTPAADATDGSITFNGSTQFTLPANRTYKITVIVKPSVAAVGYSIIICDTSNVAVGSINLPISGLANLEQNIAVAIFRPLVNTAIKVRMTSAIALTLSNLCNITIEALD